MTRTVVVTAYLSMTIALALIANGVATHQADDRLVSHIVYWFSTVGIGALATILAWFGVTRIETLALGLFVLNALINIATTVSVGPDSVFAKVTYGLGELAVCAVPLLLISFVVRRGRARTPAASAGLRTSGEKVDTT